MTRVIRKNLRPFLAIIGLFAVAAAVGGYILNEQRFRFPLFEDVPMRIDVELDNAQAVTPGQGQTAQVAGVNIGDIGEVRLEDGRAIVGLDIKPGFEDLIHSDARALLRPRTGLKDMYVQIFPGHRGAPVKDGFTIRAQSTLTDVNLDEILSSLDTRTRDYITLLADGAGRGLRGRGSDVAEVFRRFSPTFRDLARVSRSVGRERVALRRLVTSLGDVNGALARRPRDVSELVDTAATTMRAFASEDGNLRAAARELGPTLRQATTTLDAVRPFARQLGPTTRALVPAVRRLDRANDEILPFAREAGPTVRTQIRPFVRAARPLLKDLKPAAQGLRTSLPEVSRATNVINRFFNMAAHNPRGREPAGQAGREEGFLFWLAWVSHQGVNLQNIEDANGPMRPIFLTGTCGTLTSLVNDLPQAEFALGLSPILAGVCRNPDTASVSTTRALRALGKVPPKLAVGKGAGR
jgi:phospholipid/cholesterol/gamma-HCH transport system substrate-binding protein